MSYHIVSHRIITRKDSEAKLTDLLQWPLQWPLPSAVFASQETKQKRNACPNTFPSPPNNYYKHMRQNPFMPEPIRSVFRIDGRVFCMTMSLHATGKRGDSQVMERAVSRAVSCACRCVDVGVGAGVWMWVWVLFWWCGWVYTSNYARWCMSVLLLAYVCMLTAFETRSS